MAIIILNDTLNDTNRTYIQPWKLMQFNSERVDYTMSFAE